MTECTLIKLVQYLYPPPPPIQISVFESDKTECAVVLHFLRLVRSILWCIWLFRRPKMQRSFPKFFKFLILCVPVSVSVSFPSLLYFGRGGEEFVDCRSEGCFYVIFAFINMNLFPFFLFVFPFPNGNDVIDVFYHEYNITASILQQYTWIFSTPLTDIFLMNSLRGL